jgi:1,4-alpha-glucan branching enzyme
MNADELRPDEPLHQAVRVLRATSTVAAGLPERTHARGRRRTQRRRLLGAGTTLGAALLAFVLARPTAHPGEVTFALETTASSGVSLVGDFTDWETDRVRLVPDGQDKWKVTITLPPGRYRFAYVTDEGQWLADADAAPALDEFGTPTSVLTVAGE